MKTLISHATIIPMTQEELVINGDIAIDGRKIVGIGTIPASFKPERIIEAHDMIAMPSFVNAHTHVSMTYFRNYRDSSTNLHDWLSEIWKLEALLMPEDMYPATLLGLAEMISSGTTCFADMYFFPDGTAQAVLDAKMKATIGVTLFGGLEESKERINSILPSIRTYSQQSHGMLSFAIAPHAVYTCPKETLSYGVQIAQQENCKIHTHASESTNEVSSAIEEFGTTPIEHLLSCGVPAKGSFFAHCVHATPKDISLMKKLNVTVVHNPSSNCKLGNGIAPVADFLKNGIPVALGTDGASSNNTLDMFQEIRLAAMISAVESKAAATIKPYTFLEMATLGGAKALGRDNECGSLEIGKDADLMLLKSDSIHLTPVNNLFSALVFSAKSSDVDSVFCAGELLMEKRKLLTIDIEEVKQSFQSHWRAIQQKTVAPHAN